MDKEQTFWSTATPSTVPMDRAGLAALRLRQLMERAEHIGAVPAEVEKVVDEADDPKAALIDLILLTSLERQEELAKLREELDKLKLGQLKKLAKDKYKVDEAKVKAALEGDGVKGDLIAQIEREKKLDDWRGKQEDGKEEKKAALIKLIVQKEIETREKQWTDLRNELEPLKLKELKEKLLELGTDMGKVEQIIDAAEGNPRRALVSLIVIATREEKTATDALRGELKRLRLGELRRRAEEAGVEDEAVNAAIDEATDPKGAVLELIMAAEPRVAQAKAAAAAMAVDGALGVTEKEAAAAERAAAEAAARKQFNYYSGVRNHSCSCSCCSGCACLTLPRLVCVQVEAVIVRGFLGENFNAQCNGRYTPPDEVKALRAELAAQDMAALKQRAEAEQVVEMFRPFEVVEDRETIMEMIERSKFGAQQQTTTSSSNTCHRAHVRPYARVWCRRVAAVRERAGLPPLLPPAPAGRALRRRHSHP